MMCVKHVSYHDPGPMMVLGADLGWVERASNEDRVGLDHCKRVIQGGG